MVKIRLLDDPDAPVEEEAFLTLIRHKDGFAVVLVDGDGDQVSQPFILFLEPDSLGRLALSLATSPSEDFVVRDKEKRAILVNPAH